MNELKGKLKVEYIIIKKEAIDDKSKHDNIQRGLDSKRQD